jgi:hypothetical protein
MATMRDQIGLQAEKRQGKYGINLERDAHAHHDIYIDEPAPLIPHGVEV